MEYANAAGSFPPVSVGVAADEIRTEAALIWDADRNLESCAQSSQSWVRVWKEFVLIGTERRWRPRSNEAADTRTFLMWLKEI